MATSHWLFRNLDSNASKYLDEIKTLFVRECKIFTRIEGRTREDDYAKALSFEVHDPLWMLTRQWQFGRFQGNDTGSAVTAKIKINRKKMDSIYLKNNMDSQKKYSTDVPMEYDVEKRNRPITPFIRIESAIHFKKMAEELMKKSSPFAKISSVQKTELKQQIQKLIKQFPLDSFVHFTDDKDKTIDTLKTEQNENLHRLYATYGNRIFDGYKLFLAKDADLRKLLGTNFSALISDYRKWFRKK